MTPSYALRPVEEDEKDRKIRKLEKAMRKMQDALDERNQTIDEKAEKIKRLEKELRDSKYRTANKILHIHKKLSSRENYEGLVIKTNNRWKDPRWRNTKYAPNRPSTFNWIYSSRLGLVPIFNRDPENDTKLGHWYNFSVNDKRRKRKRNIETIDAVRARRCVRRARLKLFEIVDGQFLIMSRFKLHANMLHETPDVVLEDKHLNRVDLPKPMVYLIYKTLTPLQLQGELEIDTRVKVKRDFYELFRCDPNNAIFEIVSIKSIQFGGTYMTYLT